MRGLLYVLKQSEQERLWSLDSLGDKLSIDCCPKGAYKREEEDVKAYMGEISKNLIDVFSQDNLSLFSKLSAVATWSGQIERLHPFNDGNTRTFVCALQKFLQKMGLPFSHLEHPLDVSAQTPEEVVESIIKGMDNFLDYLEKKIDEKANSEEVKS